MAGTRAGRRVASAEVTQVSGWGVRVWGVYSRNVDGRPQDATASPVSLAGAWSRGCTFGREA